MQRVAGGATHHHSPPPLFWYNAPSSAESRARMGAGTLMTWTEFTPQFSKNNFCQQQQACHAHVFMPVWGPFSLMVERRLVLLSHSFPKNCPRRFSHLLWAELHMLTFYIVSKEKPHPFRHLRWNHPGVSQGYVRVLLLMRERSFQKEPI